MSGRRRLSRLKLTALRSDRQNANLKLRDQTSPDRGQIRGQSWMGKAKQFKFGIDSEFEHPQTMILQGLPEEERESFIAGELGNDPNDQPENHQSICQSMGSRLLAIKN